MDIRSLACFVAVAEELHFQRAAARASITQPALSQWIRALEAEVGARLLERNRRTVSLTPAGMAFLEPARAAIAYAGKATTEARQAAQGERGQLRLGFTVIAFYGFLPQVVRDFRDRYPNVDIVLSEMNSPRLETALWAGDLDLGILHPPLSTPDISVHMLEDEPLILAIPERHALAAQDVVKVSDLRGEPLFVAPRSIGPSIYDNVIALFATAGFSPTIVQEVTPMTMMIGLVAAGGGCGLVTRGVATAGRPGVVYRPVEPAPPSLPLAAAWRGKEPTQVARRFLDLLERVAR